MKLLSRPVIWYKELLTTQINNTILRSLVCWSPDVRPSVWLLSVPQRWWQSDDVQCYFVSQSTLHLLSISNSCQEQIPLWFRRVRWSFLWSERFHLPTVTTQERAAAVRWETVWARPGWTDGQPLVTAGDCLQHDWLREKLMRKKTNKIKVKHTQSSWQALTPTCVRFLIWRSFWRGEKFRMSVLLWKW